MSGEHVHDWRYVQRVLSDGRIQYGEQCVICGRWRATKHADVELAAGTLDLPHYEEAIADEYCREQQKAREQKWAERRQQAQVERAAKDSAWWEHYNAYLQSDAWCAKRIAVIARDARVCRGCGGRATQVHHLTYDHAGHEFLFELVSVCDACHERLHNGEGAAW